MDFLSDESEPPPKPKRKRPPAEITPGGGRVYIHPECGGATEITGGDFDHLADPFRILQGTYCCGCEQFISPDQVFWADSQESIAKYRRRCLRKTPMPLRIWRHGAGYLICGTVFAAIAWAVSPAKNPAGAIGVAAVLGLLANLFFIGPILLTRWVYRMDYRRM